MNALPPLTQLRSFVAVVERGRLKRAAEFLNLTESAVSHHLRRLENLLDARLLERGTSECVLTPAGARFYPKARDAVRLIEAGVEELTGSPGGKVVLTLPRTLATHWLVPRFPRLHAAHDDVELQLLPTTRVCDLEREHIDLGLRLGSDAWPGLVSRPLATERICLVCTPALARECAAEELHGEGWAALVARRRLIANATHPEEWTQWCAATGRALPAAVRFTPLESFDLVLQAGRSGAGLIMGRTPMVEDAIERGELVAPVPDWVATGRRYDVVWPERRPPGRHARAVVDWLESCVAGGVEASPQG